MAVNQGCKYQSQLLKMKTTFNDLTKACIAYAGAIFAFFLRECKIKNISKHHEQQDLMKLIHYEMCACMWVKILTNFKLLEMLRLIEPDQWTTIAN